MYVIIFAAFILIIIYVYDFFLIALENVENMPNFLIFWSKSRYYDSQNTFLPFFPLNYPTISSIFMKFYVFLQNTWTLWQ